MDNSKIIKILMCILAAVLAFGGCGGAGSYYGLENVEITETDTTAEVTTTNEEELLPEKVREYDYQYANHDSFDEWSFIDKYTNSVCAAICNGDFSMVQPYLLRNSALYNAQKSRVEKLYSQGTKEYVLSYRVDEMDWESNQKGTMVVYEKVDTVDSKGKSTIAEVNYEYTIEYVNGRYVLSDRSKVVEE